MDTFGITPVDASLSFWGLTVSLKWTAFIFIQSSLGFLAFIIGFLWSLWESAQRANFKYFSIFVFISLAGIFLFITPQRQESTIKSAVESSISSQSIKDSLTHDTQIPVILSFISQTADALSLDLIRKIDALLGAQLQFLNGPFGIQKLSLQANQWINSPIPNIALRQDLDNFIYEHYLPSVSMYIHTNETTDLYSLWVGDSRILGNYSSVGKSQWDGIKASLSSLMNDAQNPWAKIKETFNEMGILNANWEDQVTSSIIRGQGQAHQHFWLKWAGSLYMFFPYLSGWANFCLFIFFPFLMLAILIFRRLSLLLRYIEIFLWVKSWMLSAAVAFYVSLTAAHIQGQSSTDASWFWDYPYYLVIGSVFLVLMPIISFLGIHKCFQFFNR